MNLVNDNPDDEQMKRCEQAKKALDDRIKRCAGCRGRHRKHTCESKGMAMLSLQSACNLYEQRLDAVNNQGRAKWVFGRKIVHGESGLEYTKSWDNILEPALMRSLLYAVHSHVKTFQSQMVTVTLDYGKQPL